jgi:hypothetical protein
MNSTFIPTLAPITIGQNNTLETSSDDTFTIVYIITGITLLFICCFGMHHPCTRREIEKQILCCFGGCFLWIVFPFALVFSIIYYPIKFISDRTNIIWILFFPTSEIIVNAEPYNELANVVNIANVVIDIQEENQVIAHAVIEAPQIQLVAQNIPAA